MGAAGRRIAGVLPVAMVALAVAVSVPSVALRAMVAQQTPQVARPWPQERPPGPLQARSVKFPDFKLKTLANGLQVLHVAQNEQPSVSTGC